MNLIAVEKKRLPWGMISNGLIMALLLIAVAALTIQNRNLKAELENIYSPPTIRGLNVGEKMPGFRFTSLDGSKGFVNYSDPSMRYVFFIFSTTCPYCERNVEQWKFIVSRYARSSYLFLGLSIHDLSRTTEYADTKDLNYQVCVVDSSFRKQYKIAGVPQMLVIDADGTVRGSWGGAVNDQSMDEIKRLVEEPGQSR